MIGRHVTVYAVARGGAGVLNFCAVALYTRLLLPEEYGRYALLMASAGVIGAILFQWLRSGARRFLLSYRDDRAAFLASLGRAYLLSILTLAVLTAAMAVAVSGSQLRWLILLGFALLVVQGWFDLNLELLLANLEPVRYGWFALGRSLLGFATGAALAWKGFGAVGVAIGAVIGYAIPAAVFTIDRWREVRLAAASPDMERVLLGYGLPLTATFALDFVVGYSDRLLVGVLAGLGEAGRYAVAYDLPQQTITAVLMIVNLASFPLVVRALEEQGFAGATPHILRHGTLIALLGLPAMVGLALLAPNTAHVFLGVEFRDGAARLIPVIAVAALIAGLKSFFFDLSFQLGRNTQTQIWVSGFAAILNVLLNLWWIPTLGGLGAAYATLVAFTVGLGLSWGLGQRRLPLPLPVRDWVKIAIAAAIMGLAILPLVGLRGPLGLALQVAAGGLSYGLLLLTFNVLGLRQRAVALARRRRP
ncbi:MAG: polysaccharide biosynthesis C-terminal domain-containing protein [Gemmatimonadota bacterium]